MSQSNITTEWNGFDLSSDSQYTKMIKKIEFLIRKSFQYDIWQKRSKIGVKECPICEENLYYVKPESHHYPLTLFDIVDNKLQYLIQKNELDNYDEFDICQMVMHDHIMGQVDFVVLCKQCHEKFHDSVPNVITKMADAFKEQKEKREAYINKVKPVIDLTGAAIISDQPLPTEEDKEDAK